MKRILNIITLLVFVVLLGGNTAISQINSYSINQTVTNSSGSFTMDVNSDGNDDYSFEILSLSGTANAARVVSLGNSQVMDASTFGYPDALDFGDEVSGPYSSGNAVLGTDVGGAGEFSGAGMKYLGLNIDIEGESHLGWISLEVVSSNDTIFILDVGYNTISGEGITAGQVSATSITEMSTIDFDVYPNPSQDFITINAFQHSKGANYSISDLSGKLVVSGEIAKKIDVSMLESGTYLFTIIDGQNIGRKKFMIN